jgi:sorting nexin-1/2
MEPVKHGEGVTAYVSYHVVTKTNHPAYTRPANDVVRRYSHFAWLHEQLAAQHKGVIMPPLPEKSAVQKFQMATEFINARRRALQVGV